MLLSYSLISSFILGFGFLAYRLVMAGERQHSFNRSFILLIYGVSLILPFLLLSIIMRHPVSPSGLSTIEIGQLSGGIMEPSGESMHYGWFTSESLARLIFRIYIVGMLLTAGYSIFGAVMLWNIIRKGERIEFDHFTLVLVDSPNVAPFSWKRSVIMSRSDYKDAGNMILLHECAHLRLSHWADLVVAQIVLCLQWYNPAAWTLREDLKAVHEYQADEAVLSSGIDLRQYQMLLIKKAVGSRFQSLANSLNHSKLKKRVTMMYKKKTSAKRRLGALLLVPALAAGCAVTAIPAVAGVLESFAVSGPSVSSAQASVLSRSSNPEAPAGDDKEIYMSVEQSAEFPGGQGALMQYLTQNMRYPEEAYKANEQGRVIVKFVIGADGTVSDAQIIKGVSPSIDKEALRIVSGMPKWIPGKVNGKAVASWFNLPLSFKLQDNTPKEENK